MWRARAKGYDVLGIRPIDRQSFIQYLEQRRCELSFKRVDSDTIDQLIQKDDQQESVPVEGAGDGQRHLHQCVGEDSHATIQLKALSPDDQPVWIPSLSSCAG